MDEKMKDLLLAQVLKKQAFRDNRHRTRPSGLDVVRMMLLAGNSAGAPEHERESRTGTEEYRPA